MLKGRQRKHSSLRPFMVSSLFSPVVRSDRFRRSMLSFLHLSYMLGRAVGLGRLMLSLSVFVHVCLSLCWLLAVCVCFRPPAQCFPMISICPICPWLTCLRGSCRFVPPVIKNQWGFLPACCVRLLLITLSQISSPCLVGSHVDAWSQDWLFPGRYSSTVRWHEGAEAYRVPRGSTTLKQNVW